MTGRDPSKAVAFWLSELKAARKREECYRKTGQEVMDLYAAEQEQEQETPFNILYSNTETLRPALFSAQPRPVVQRRFKDADPLGKLASEASRRMLEYHFDTNRDGYETLNEAMSAAVLDALLPGRGAVMLKYDADFVPIDEPRPPDEHDDTPVDLDARTEYAQGEQVCYESVVWDRVLFGYAKKWTKVPWIAYQFHLTKEEVASLLGNAVAVKLTYQSAQADCDRPGSRREEDEDAGERRTAVLYQIWDKAGGKKVRYVSPNYPDDELRVDDDPLGLTGFFNMPRPLLFVEKSCSLVPTAPYRMYKSQADELNRITRRIKKLTEAIKARGIYDGSISGDLERLMQKDDNTLVPAEVASSLSTEKGFQNAIWFLPLDVLIGVVQQLYQAREACKQTIYEITGIADIMRGATNASETLGAQQIKNQWGTLRLKRMQQEVERYVRDLERMTLDIATSKFDEATWAAMTGLPFVTTAQRQQMEQQAAILTQTQQPMPPELQQQLGQPVWGQVLQLLRDDLQRSYRIDIETNSTVQPEASEDLEAMQELMQVLGMFLQSVGPLVANGTMPFAVAQQMMLGVARRTRFGPEIEDALQAMQPPKPPDDGAALQQQQMQLDQQMAVKEIEHKRKESAMALKEQAMQIEAEQQQREMALQLREMELQVKEHQFGMHQQVEQGMLNMQKQRATEEIGTKQTLQALQEKKYNTEAVVNKKTDTAMNQVTKAVQQVQALGESLQAVQQQAAETQQLLMQLIRVTSARRIKTPIRGKDGRIERVEDQMEAA